MGEENKTSVQIPDNIIRQIFFLAVLILLGWVLFKELYFMMSAFLGAITLYVILLHPIKYLVIVKKWRPWLAALILILLSLVILVVPVIYLTSAVVGRIMPYVNDPQIINDTFEKVHTYLTFKFNIDILTGDNIQKISEQIIPIIQKILGGTFSAVGNILLMYMILFFMLINTRQVKIWIKKILPFRAKNANKTIKEVKNLVYSNAIGIPLVAIIQGAAGILGYWIFGVEEYLLMGLLTAISSVIPIVGTMIIFLPLAVYQFATGTPFQGIGVALWGLLVIGSVDNVARFMIQKKLADVHPLVTLLGVIIGVNVFGFIGIVFGPLLISLFFILARIYSEEFGDYKNRNLNRNSDNGSVTSDR